MKFFALVLSLSLLFACKQTESKKKVVTENQSSFIVDVPYLDNIIIDGNDNDWDKKGLLVNLYSDDYGELIEANDCQATFKLAWNKKGLLLLVNVIDDKIFIDKNIKWAGDGIEAFMIDSVGGKNMIQYMLLPINDLNSIIKSSFVDRRKKLNQKNKIDFNAVSKTNDNGYSIEALFPFENLNIKPQVGNTLAFQLYVNDFDKKRDNEKNKLIWFYKDQTYKNTFSAQQIKLVDTIVAPLKETVKAWLIDKETLNARILFLKDNSHKNLIITLNNQIIFDSTLIADSSSLGYFDYSKTVNDSTNDYLEFVINSQLVYGFNINNLNIKYVNLPKPHEYEQEIKDFEREDLQYPPQEGATMFIGSSSIRFWKSLKQDMEGINVIHRGFGGSKATDVLYFMDRIVIPDKPAKIVYYEGDNDIGSGGTPEEFIANTKEFIQRVHEKLPETKIYILSIKPSVKRIDLWDIASQANKQAVELANQYDFVEFIDVASAMFDKEGKIRRDIFIGDSLHMNPTGYAIWTKIVREIIMN